MDKEELKDEICGDLGEMEVLIQTRDTKNELQRNFEGELLAP